MKILIVGAGEIGRHMAEHLSKESHQIVVIEADEKLAGELDDHIDARVMSGNGASVTVLLDAGIDECDLFMALTSCNDTNLVACSIAKELGAKKVICRVHPSIQRTEWLFNYRERFGIDYLFSPERLSAVELAKHIRYPNSIAVEEIARGHIELQQFEVNEKSSMLDKPLREMNLPERVLIGGISRGNSLIIPAAHDVLKPNDIITVIGEPRKIDSIAGKLGQGVGEHSSVVIFGGGEYGAAVAELLKSWHCKVRVMESDATACEDLTNRLEGATILNVDATSLHELREERIGDADFFVAASTSDEDNVMTCLQAHNLGATHCLTLIHRADYADAISAFGEHFGIMSAVSPREATRSDLMRFVTSDSYHLVKALGTEAEIIEASVVEGAAIADQVVREVPWPEGSLLVTLLRGINARVPAANDVIRVGDSIYAIVSKQTKPAFLQLLKGHGKPGKKAPPAAKDSTPQPGSDNPKSLLDRIESVIKP